MNTVVPLASRGQGPRQPVDDHSDVLTVAQTAHRLSLSVNSTYVYLANGTIPGLRVGRRWIIPRARLDAWLAGQSERGS